MKPPRYYLEKPVISKADQQKTIAKLPHLGDAIHDAFKKANVPAYLYWDELKYKTPVVGLTAQESWFVVRQLRTFSSREIFLRAETGKFFTWIRLPSADEFLHRIDMYAGGQIFPATLTASTRKQFVIRGIIEESIASSQLEGAHTTRAAAKKMLLEKRIPRNQSEQMILNNYRTIVSIEEKYKESELSLELMFELHRKLTENVIPVVPRGRLRNNEDDIIVQGPVGNEEYITHVPPKESFLNEEIKRLIAYANDQEDTGFTHPVIKAIFLHFWIGYLHPFTDGNGRLARALFYWYLLKKGYWTMMYLPISTIIKRAPLQYAMAYIHTEQDNFDITYFYDFHMKKIIQSLNEFESYLKNKVQENRKMDETLGRNMNLNERQKRLLHYVLSDDGASMTVSSHAEINSISRQTAAKDLQELQNKTYLVSKREGKFIRYHPSKKLLELKGRF